MFLTVFSMAGLPEIRPGDDVAAHILAWNAQIDGDLRLRADDLVVVTQKVVSKAEGRLVRLADVKPRAEAVEFGQKWERDPRQVEVVLRESVRVLRMELGLIISETRHGFVCANAGVDLSNAGEADVACLLPDDADASARRIRDTLEQALGVRVGVMISDTFGRPWRNGITNVAIGVAGFRPLVDYRGRSDPHGYELKSTWVAVADEMAAAAELVMGKTDRAPVAVLRGYPTIWEEGSIRELVMDSSRDLFH
ncbi:MAG TPA: coenzyme F420-0:L-glutamate ligase [Candidatus Xenobia bacterium]|jgi:coenzyme F420-0:L-glutamate ligase/coenzyme F420-1:gamma-L-glutamate ligase